MNVENGVSYGSANPNGNYGGEPESSSYFFNNSSQMMPHGIADQQPTTPQQQQQQQQMVMHQQPQQQQQQQQPVMGYPMTPSPNSMMRFGPSHLHGTGISSPALARALSTLSADRNRRPRSEKKPIPDEQKDDKYFERRRRNNEAAKKSRDARKAREDELAIRASFLEKDNSILKVQVHSMREEAMKMRELWVAKCQGLAISRQQMQQQQPAQQMVQPQAGQPQQPQQQQQMTMANGGTSNGRAGSLMLNQPDGYP